MPLTSTQPRLGELERVVMEHLWALSGETAQEHQPDGEPHGSSVREVLEEFSGDRKIAYTTVMTVLSRLVNKGLVTRERDGRAWRYRPIGTRESLTAETMRRTMDDMHVTDRRTALLHFLDGASPQELSDLKEALAEVEARQEEDRMPPRKGLRGRLHR